MTILRSIISTMTALSINGIASAAYAVDVRITDNLESVAVIHNGKKVVIMRNQDPDNKVNPSFALTSRECPPYCVQPGTLSEGVETIGELEMIEYLKRSSYGDDTILVIDSRTPDWVAKGTIPGTVNIPWTTLNPLAGADPFTIADILEQKFGAVSQEGLWDYSKAKTLVLFCNGMWCSQSPNNIRTLLRFGYPPGKLKWYRGGMQNWENLGLTTTRPD